MKISAVGILLTILASTQSQASDFKPWRSIGGWDISRNSEDQACQMSSAFEGEGSTIVMVNYTPSTDTASFIIGNQGWTSLEKGDDPTVTLDFGAAGTWADVETTSMVTDTYRWLSMNLDGKDFIVDFTIASSLKITKGDVIVDKLSLSGTKNGVLELVKCGNTLNKGIARDPFSEK